MKNLEYKNIVIKTVEDHVFRKDIYSFWSKVKYMFGKITNNRFRRDVCIFDFFSYLRSHFNREVTISSNFELSIEGKYIGMLNNRGILKTQNVAITNALYGLISVDLKN